MKLNGIKEEINFSKEILSSADSLAKLREDGLTKVKRLKVELKNTKDEALKNSIKAEINTALEYQKSVQAEDDKIKKEALSKLNGEYKEFKKKVQDLVKKERLNTKNEYLNRLKDIESEYSNNLNQVEAYKISNPTDEKGYKEQLNGVKTKYKRSLKTYNKERMQADIDHKKAIVELRLAYVDLRNKIAGNNNLLVDFVTERIEAVNSTSFEKTIKDSNFWLSKVSLFCFLALALVYIIVCLAAGIDIEYEKILEGSSIIIAVALGGVFIYSMKSFDMSLGGATALAAAIGGIVWQNTKNIFLVLLIGIIIGVIIELINSALASVLKLPVMVTTLAMSSVLSSILTNVLETSPTQTIAVKGIKDLDTFIFYFGVILALFLITAFIFNKTTVGRKNKMIGTNSVSSKYSGINITKQGLITFLIAGICVGVGSMLYLVRSRTVSANSCSTIGLDVILAIVFGGMQTTGGPKSKISAAILGGLTASLISYLLIAIARATGFKEITNYESFVKGVLFLSIVSVNMIGNKTNRLPAIEMLW